MIFGRIPTITGCRESISAFDLPQNLVVSYSYDLPFGKLSKSAGVCWMDGRLLGSLVSLPVCR